MVSMIADQLYRMIRRPGAYFGRNEYSFKEVISFLNGFSAAQNIYSEIDERNYIYRVKQELAKKYKFDPNMNIIDLFDSICENDSEKVMLLMEVMTEIYNYRENNLNDGFLRFCIYRISPDFLKSVKTDTSRLSELTDGRWFKEFGLNISLNRRKMFLKNGKLNPHFDLEKFKGNTDYNLLYISYEEDGESDCLSVGFNCCDVSERLKIYEFFLHKKELCCVYLMAVPEYEKYSCSKNVIKLYSSGSFDYFACFAALNGDVSGLPEEYISGIIYTENFCSDGLCMPVSGDIEYINAVMRNADIFLLKTPRYAGYNYLIFYSDRIG